MSVAVNAFVVEPKNSEGTHNARIIIDDTIKGKVSIISPERMSPDEAYEAFLSVLSVKGFTLVPTAMYWKRGRAKLEIGLAKGKKLHDKRADEKDRDWQREKQRIFKKG